MNIEMMASLFNLLIAFIVLLPFVPAILYIARKMAKFYYSLDNN
jgi:hypothetical protein